MSTTIDFSSLPSVVPRSGKTAKNTREMVYTTLRTWIVYLYLVPGVALVDKEICAYLDVSQTPVREAFLQLAKDGVLNVYPQRGTYVAKISVERANEARLIRRGIEREVLTSLKLPLRKDLLLAMQHNLFLQDMICQESDKPENAVEFFRLDNDFHAIFFEHAGLSRVWEMIEQYSMNSDRGRILYLQNNTDWKYYLDQHQVAWEAASKGSNKKLMLAWDTHFDGICGAATIARDMYPEYFT